MKNIFRLLLILCLLIGCSKEEPKTSITYTLDILVIPENGGTTSPSGGSFDEGTSVTITGIPSTRYSFKESNGDVVGTSNPFTITMNSDKTITVVFEETDTDGDGVMNDIEQCPNTPDGEVVNEFGCSSSQLTYIPDNNFEQRLIELGYDEILDDYVITDNIKGINALYLTGSGIHDLTGIEDFIALVHLNCSGNQLTDIDLSNNKHLTTLDCGYNKITNLVVSSNPSLKTLICSNNQLKSLLTSNNADLTNLELHFNELSNLDLSKNPQLTNLGCLFNNLSGLDVSHNPKLRNLSCGGLQLTSLDLSKNTSLDTLEVYETQIGYLDLGNNISLTRLNCSYNQLTSLDLSNNLSLKSLQLIETQITDLNVSNNILLEMLTIERTQIHAIDLSENKILTHLDFKYNPLTSLDVSSNQKLTTLWSFDNNLASLNVSEIPNLTTLVCRQDQPICIKVNQAQFSNIPATWQKDSGSKWSLDCNLVF